MRSITIQGRHVRFRECVRLSRLRSHQPRKPMIVSSRNFAKSVREPNRIRGVSSDLLGRTRNTCNVTDNLRQNDLSYVPNAKLYDNATLLSGFHTVVTHNSSVFRDFLSGDLLSSSKTNELQGPAGKSTHCQSIASVSRQGYQMPVLCSYGLIRGTCQRITYQCTAFLPVLLQGYRRAASNRRRASMLDARRDDGRRHLCVESHLYQMDDPTPTIECVTGTRSEHPHKNNNALACTSCMRRYLTTLYQQRIYILRASGMLSHRIGAFQPNTEYDMTYDLVLIKIGYYIGEGWTPWAVAEGYTSLAVSLAPIDRSLLAL